MTSVEDVLNNVNIDLILAPILKSADVNSSSVDLRGYAGCTFVAAVGAAGDTFGVCVYTELEVEESADNTNWTDVANADLSAYVTGTNTGTFAKIDANGKCGTYYAVAYRGTKRYARVVVNVTGTHSTGTSYAVLCIKSGASVLPCGD